MSTRFGAQHWIVANVEGGPALSNSALAAVADFAIMWNLFESLAFGPGKAKPHTFEDLATRRFGPNGTTPRAIADALRYWKTRYIEDGATNAAFKGLRLGAHDKKALVTDVLLGNRHDAESDVTVAMILSPIDSATISFTASKTSRRSTSRG